MLSLIKSKKVARLVPALIWMGAIFYLSSVPNLKLQGEFLVYDFILRKLAHVSEYTILYLLWCRALRDYPQARVAAGVITIFYAISDEIHQFYVPTRDGKFVDVIVNTTGIIVGETIRKAKWV